MSFSATLPVKPSVTTTSALPAVIALPSTLPTKFRPVGGREQRVGRDCTIGVPFVASSPLESSATRGRSTPEDASP